MIPRIARTAAALVMVAALLVGCGLPGSAFASPPGPAFASPPGPASASPPGSPASVVDSVGPTGPTATVRVVRIVDGDTIVVRLDGHDRRLRYIGMNTPETVKPDSPVERFGPEASAANAALVAGREVVLEKDVSETDRFGRLLRYVWLTDGGHWTLVNLELVARGFAQVETDPPDVKYADRFLVAQRLARAAGLGLWGAGAPPVSP